MKFYPLLLARAQAAVGALEQDPHASALLDGTMSIEQYGAFLTCVVQQVSLSSGMLEQASRGLERVGRPNLAALLGSKADEERGHHEWALDDAQHLGLSRAPVLAAPIHPAVAAYHAWWRHVVLVSPVGIVGVAFQLEYFAYSQASKTADNLVAHGVPETAVTFLRKHGEADQEHIAVLGSVLDEVEDAEDQEAILLSASVTASLYRGFCRAAPDRPAGACHVAHVGGVDALEASPESRR
jgi:hypothetical protein